MKKNIRINQLFVEPTGDGDNNEQVCKTLGVTEGMYLPDCSVVGGTADLVQVNNMDKLIVLIQNKEPRGRKLKFNVFEKPQDQSLPRRIEVAIKSNQLEVLQIFNRRIRRNLLKISRSKRDSVEPLRES